MLHNMTQYFPVQILYFHAKYNRNGEYISGICMQKPCNAGETSKLRTNRYNINERPMLRYIGTGSDPKVVDWGIL